MSVRTSVLLFFLPLLSLIFTQVAAQEEEKKVVFEPEASFRSFWMQTSYAEKALKFDHALGMTAYLGGNWTVRKNWELRVGYRAFGNVASSPIWEPDPLTGQPNRYEAGLFDLLAPEDQFFGRLETFSLGYSKPKFGIKLGKMGVQTDWVNAQDGRLSPTVVEGIHGWFSPSRSWKINVWGINRLNIRGSKDWLPVGQTLGIYSQGRTVSGKAASYFGQTDSKWLGIWELERSFAGGGKFKLTQTVADNLFATYGSSFEQAKVKASGTWSYGIQAGLQHGIGVGGNADESKRYKDPEDLNFSISAKLGWKKGSWELQLSSTQVGGKGRWLSPREWGKDAWYTFIPRERNEGYASVTAVVGYASYRFNSLPLQLYSFAGLHYLPDPLDAGQNKYNFPSYRQLNIGLKYAPSLLKNTELHVLLVNKESLDTYVLAPVQVYNKVSLWHLNVMLNWKLSGK
jgi:hypothetical protein